MTDRHKTPTITFRPPADLRSWLTELARITDSSVGAIVVSALREYRERSAPQEVEARRQASEQALHDPRLCNCKDCKRSRA